MKEQLPDDGDGAYRIGGHIEGVSTDRFFYSNAVVDAAIVLGMQEGLGVDETLAAALLTTENGVHATGLPGYDADAMARINQCKRAAATGFVESYTFMRSPARGLMETDTHAQLRGIRRADRRAGLRQELDWASPVLQRWAHMAFQLRDRGVEVSPLVGEVMSLHRLSYAPELGITTPAAYGTRDLPLVRAAFSDFEHEQGMTQTDLSLRLRAYGVMDASQERLHSRTENALAVVQLAIGLNFLRNLEDMWSAGGAARVAGERLFAAQRAALLRNDYALKEVMLDKAAAALESIVSHRQLAVAEHQLLDAMAFRIRKYLADLADIRQQFVTIYERLGYAIPPRLAAVLLKPEEMPKAEEPVAVAAAVGPVVVAHSLETARPEPDAEVVVSLQSRAADLAKRAAQVDRPWTMTDQERKKTGLDAAVRILTSPQGCRTVTGASLLPTMERPAARELVAVLRRLSVIGGQDVTKGQETLGRLLHEQALAADESASLYDDVRAAGPNIPITLPSLIPVTSYLERFRNRWPLYQQVLLSIWPPQTVIDTTARIQRVLFPEA